MKKILIIIPLMILSGLTLSAQTDQQDLDREVTMYNPYKPSLPEFKKRSYLPDINDTSKLRPDFTYDIVTNAYTPSYTISPIKPAALHPDPLPKLYKSYVKLGFGNYVTPMAELSITNERSKKGAIGFYGRHFSTNGKIRLKEDVDKVFAGYMDNDVSLYGKKFFRGSLLEGSVDFTQKLRYAYGYDTSIVDYRVENNKEIRLGYSNLGADISFASLTLDSSSYSYDFDVNYDYFFHTDKESQHNIGLTGTMATKYEGFYIGSGLDIQYFMLSDSLYEQSKYVASVSPFVKKSTPQWNFRAGVQLLFDRDIDKLTPHIYPDVNFGFSVVPSYVRFFAALNGKLEINEPKKIIEENPFLLRDGSLFKQPNTSHNLIISAGLNGNNGIGGNYVVSASYSLINDMLFYANQVDTVDLISPEMGNLFAVLPDDGEVLNIHGEMTGSIKDKVIYGAEANFYNYSFTRDNFPINRPDWDATLGLKYNLRNKIIAGVEVIALGKRQLAYMDRSTFVKLPEMEPVHVNINLNVEYRYTKILSLWLKVNNIAFNRYYEYAFYPTQRFVCMIGLSYSM